MEPRPVDAVTGEPADAAGQPTTDNSVPGTPRALGDTDTAAAERAGEVDRAVGGRADVGDGDQSGPRPTPTVGTGATEPTASGTGTGGQALEPGTVDGVTGGDRESADQLGGERPSPASDLSAGDSGERPPGPAELSDPAEADPAGAGPPRDSTGRTDSTDDIFLAMIARFDEVPSDRGWPSAEDVADPRAPLGVSTLPELGDRLPHPADPARPDPTAAATTDSPASTRPDDPDPANPFDLELGPLDSELADPTAATRERADRKPALGEGASGSAAEEDEHYEPRPAPPAPRMKPVTRLALSSIALGLAILFVPTFVGYRGSSTQDVAGVLLILGGVGTLVAKMGERPPTDSDGPDDGAVI